MARGGRREGAGRKPKVEMMKLLERMDAILADDEALKILAEKVKEGSLPAIKLWLAYRYGKPREYVEEVSREDIKLPPWLQCLQVEYVNGEEVTN